MIDSDTVQETIGVALHEWVNNFPCPLKLQVFVPLFIPMNELIDGINDSVKTSIPKATPWIK